MRLIYFLQTVHENDRVLTELNFLTNSYIIKKTIFKFFNLKLRRKITLFNRRCRRSICCCCWNRFRISSFRICPFRIFRLRSKLSRFRTRFFGEIGRFGLTVRFANRRIFWTVIGRQIWKKFPFLISYRCRFKCLK